MGSPYLVGVRAKIQRADEHIGELTELSRGIVDDLNYSVRKEYDADSEEHVFTLHIEAPQPRIPERFSVIAGEAAHQLRSALDHLICRLFVKETGVGDLDKLSGLYFPILDKATDKKGKPTFPKGKIKRIGRKAVAFLKGLQPYNVPVKPEHHPLSVIRDLSNTDKHRSILVVMSAADRTGMVLGEGDVGHGLWLLTEGHVTAHKGAVPLKHGTEVARFPGPSDVQMDIKLAPVVAFDEVGLSKLKPVIRRLKKSRDEVVSIVDEFERRFF